MSDSSRLHYARLAWFEPDPPALGDIQLRPLSLGSKSAMELMELTVMDEAHGLTEEQETMQILLYIWLHTAPITEITGALWDGSWLAFGNVTMEQDPKLLEEMRRHFACVRPAIAASLVKLRSREKSKHDDTPLDVIGLTDLGHRIFTLIRVTGWTERRVMWHLWLPKALQLYHGELRRQGVWTIAPPRPVDPTDYEDTVPEFLK